MEVTNELSIIGHTVDEHDKIGVKSVKVNGKLSV